MIGELERHKEKALKILGEKENVKKDLLSRIESKKNDSQLESLTDSLKKLEWETKNYFNSYFKIKFIESNFNCDTETLFGVLGSEPYTDKYILDFDRVKERDNFRYSFDSFEPDIHEDKEDEYKEIDLSDEINFEYKTHDAELMSLPDQKYLLKIDYFETTDFFLLNEDGKIEFKEKWTTKSVRRYHVANNGDLIFELNYCEDDLDHSDNSYLAIFDIKLKLKREVAVEYDIGSITSSANEIFVFGQKNRNLYIYNRQLALQNFIDLSIFFDNYTSLSYIYYYDCFIYITIDDKVVMKFNPHTQEMEDEIELEEQPMYSYKIDFIDPHGRLFIMTRQCDALDKVLSAYDDEGYLLYEKCVDDNDAFCISQDGKLVLYNGNCNYLCIY